MQHDSLKPTPIFLLKGAGLFAAVFFPPDHSS